MTKKEVKTVTDMFADKMKEELLKSNNMGKKPWSECSRDYLIQKLSKHVKTNKAQFNSGFGTSPQELIHIANYAMMLYDKKG